jgi:Fe-S oxidoreductase
MDLNIPVLFPNQLAHERSALGLTLEQLSERASIDSSLYRLMEDGRILPDHEELARLTAALGGVDPARIYAYSLVNTIGDARLRAIPGGNDVRGAGESPNYKAFFDGYQDAGHLLIAPDELRWFEREAQPDGPVEVFVNMSCGTQQTPHLMLDTVAVLRALGVRLAAGAGRLFCCGTYYRRNADYDLAARMNDAAVGRALAWGAATTVHMCTQCVNTFSEIAHRRTVEQGEQPIAHTQVLRFIDERLAELGDRVPWKKEIRRRVVGHGHATYSYVHERAKHDVGRIARRIPGVEFVGFLERMSLDSFCDTEPGVPRRPAPKTRGEVAAYRDELARVCAEWGADTVSPQHQGCNRRWSWFSSETVDVRHVISLLAEALGVASPDRHLAASRLGDTKLIVEQTRPIWTAWGMSEEKATDVARKLFDPAYATVDTCACGKGDGGACGTTADVIPIDVLTGVTPPR